MTDPLISSSPQFQTQVITEGRDMIMTDYTHRLPADYDLCSIRQRASERAKLWAATPDLYFKAFLLREKGRLGAVANSYTSLYLWRDTEAFRDWIVEGRLEYVATSFGRPSIGAHLVVATQRGAADTARFATIADTDVPIDADVAKIAAREIERVHEMALNPTVVVAAVGLDTLRWRLRRVVLSDAAPEIDEARTVYELLQVAAPLLDSLPCS